ncbi:hypothetical protein ACWA7J_02660 [Leptothrix sp. BB-4]
MTQTRLEAVYARSRTGQSQALLTGRATTLAERLLLRLNGYSPLAMLVTAAEQPFVAQAVEELLDQGWIEAVLEDDAAPAESQWGAIDTLGLAA